MPFFHQNSLFHVKHRARRPANCRTTKRMLVEWHQPNACPPLYSLIARRLRSTALGGRTPSDTAQTLPYAARRSWLPSLFFALPTLPSQSQRRSKWLLGVRGLFDAFPPPLLPALRNSRSHDAAFPGALPPRKRIVSRETLWRACSACFPALRILWADSVPRCAFFIKKRAKRKKKRLFHVKQPAFGANSERRACSSTV